MTRGEVQELLRLARAFCAEKLPWFAPALYQARIILTEQIPVAAIDINYNVYFNPEPIRIISQSSSNKQESMAQIGFIWIHEISHVLRQHADRCQDIKGDKYLWNIAADFEINDSQWKGLQMPQKFQGLLPQKFLLPMGKLAEFYYHKILKDKDALSKLEQLGLSDWNEGSGVHKKTEVWEQGGQSDDKNNQRQKLHPIDIELTRKAVAQKMYENRHLIGNMPGSWGLWIEKVLQSKTDWRKILRHRLSLALSKGIGLKVDYSFTRPSRRQAIYSPIVTPSFSGSLGGRFAIVVDTSGSMSGQWLEQAIGEVYKILDDFKLPITVIPCDAIAYEPILLKKPSDRFKVRQLQGGGGTDMTVGIQVALKLKPQPDTILVLTDGYTPYPNTTFQLPVIFGIIKQYQESTTPLPNIPPWTKTSIVDVLITM